MAARKRGVIALKFVLWAGALAPAAWIAAGSFLG